MGRDRLADAVTGTHHALERSDAQLVKLFLVLGLQLFPRVATAPQHSGQNVLPAAAAAAAALSAFWGCYTHAAPSATELRTRTDFSFFLLILILPSFPILVPPTRTLVVLLATTVLLCWASPRPSSNGSGCMNAHGRQPCSPAPRRCTSRLTGGGGCLVHSQTLLSKPYGGPLTRRLCTTHQQGAVASPTTCWPAGPAAPFVDS